MSADFAPTTQFSPFDDEPAPRCSLLWRWLRRRNPDLQDARTGLLNRRGLMVRGDALLGAKCERATLIVLDFEDLLESADLWGDRAVDALQARLAKGLRTVAGRRGLAARTGPSQFAVLVPGACRQAGIDALAAVFGQPCSVELEWDGEELVCVPEVAAEVWESDPGGLRPLYAHLCAVLARHRERRVRHHAFLRRERERHSRPFGTTQGYSLPESVPG